MVRRSSSPSLRLGLPELLAPGPYEQVLILTFGTDLEFYERVLRRHFGGFRNQIVLADGSQLDSSLSRLAASGTLRHLNRSWIAGPIRMNRAAHAKVILLAGPEAGLLLVGSGNLNLSGYAGAGECFTPYRWTPEQTQDLDAFTAVRELTDGLVSRGDVDAVTADRLGVFWSAYDWWHAAPNPAGALRHNLQVPLGTQFVEEIQGEAVDELTVVAPFHDPNCAALERLASTLDPAVLRVLVQPGRCSVDPDRLMQVVQSRDGTVQAVTAAGDYELAYLHAKIYLAKTKTRSICLVGSANCSMVALWLDPPAANVEIGSLLTGTPTDFDHLLHPDVVTVTEPVDPHTLELELRDGNSDEDTDDDASVVLSDLAVSGDKLTWTTSGISVSAVDVVIEVDGRVAVAEIAIEQLGDERLRFVARLVDQEDIATVEAVAVVTVRLGGGPPSFAVPYQIERLREQDRRRVDADRLRHAAQLELDDPDLQQALAALEEILVGDNVARWGRDKTTSAPDGHSGAAIAWEDIDWTAVRRHPRYGAYGGLAGFGAPGSALAYYLGALSQLVRELLDEEDEGEGPSPDEPAEHDPDDEEQEESDVASGVEGADPDDEDDADEADAPPVAHQSPSARNRRLVRNFVRRNLAVLEQEGFRDGAGPGIVVPNAIILNWVCWWVATKEETNLAELVHERLRLWALLWGDESSAGYLESLDDEYQALVLERFDNQRFEAVTVASIADLWSSIPTATDPLYRHLREILRRAVCSPCWQVTGAHLAAAATLMNKRPSTIDPIDEAEIAERLWDTACAPHFGLEARGLVAAALGGQVSDVTASQVEVIVDGRSDRRSVDQMEIATRVTAPEVEGAFTSWMGVEDLDFYRLKWPTGVGFYNALTESGWVVPDDGDELTLERLSPAYPRWRVELDRLADGVESEVGAAA